jgi:hypothetical protein
MTEGGEEFTGTERFQLVRQLGSGGMGVVYEAYDRERKLRVALKTLKPMASADFLRRFKNEFRSLAGLVHPNLVTLYELFAVGDQWFFTMELIDGISLLEFVRPGGSVAEVDTTAPVQRGVVSPPRPVAVVGAGSRLDLERLRSSLRQLAAGVAALHRGGKLHRDLKPSNVLVTAHGRVVVCDFGLVTELSAELQSGEARIGTASFMSPEQAAGRPLTEASDWYSVGVMLYAALTGRLPFEGINREVLTRKLIGDPPRASSFEPTIPADLDAICWSLLRRVPTARPSGREACQALGYLDDESRFGAPIAVPFVGRTSHTAALAQAFADARDDGQCVTVHVHGNAGMGKTALVQRFLDQARRQGALVLRGSCHEREAVPFNAFDRLVDDLAAHLTTLPELEPVAPRHPRELANLFKALALLPHAGEYSPELDPREQQRRAFAAMRELLGKLAKKQPLVLHLDDLQWGDRESAELLAAITEAPGGPPMLAILSYRSEDVATSACLRRARLALEDPKQETREIRVDPLSRAVDLAATLLGGSGATARAQAIALEAEGRPHLVGELARYARKRPSGGTEVSLEKALAARLRKLPAEALSLLHAIAVAGGPIERSIAESVAGLVGSGLAQLTTLQMEHLARTRTSGNIVEVDVFDDLVRGAVLGSLDDETRRECHRRLATTLESLGAGEPEMLVEHWVGAGDLAGAANRAVSIAERAVGRRDFDRACRMLRFAIELQPDAAMARSWRLRLVESLAAAGREAEAAALCRQAGAATTGAEAIDLECRAASHLLRAGHLREGLAAGSAALARAGSPFDWARSDFWSRALPRRRTQSAPGGGASMLHRSLAGALLLSDPMAAGPALRRNLELAEAAGDGPASSKALALLAAAEPGRAAQLLERARSLVEPEVDLVVDGILDSASAALLLDAGRWREARERSLVAQQKLLTCDGVSWELTWARLIAARARVWLGEVATLRRELLALLEDAERRQDRLFAAHACSGPIQLVCLASDEPVEARQHALRIAGVEESGVVACHRLVAETEVDLYTGETATALTRTQQASSLLASPVARIPAIRIALLHARARSLIAALAEGAVDGDALPGVERDLARLERLTDWSAPLARLLRAAVCLLRDDREGAIETCGAAARAFDDLGMPLWATAARRRQGQLTGGAPGHEELRHADDAMFEAGVRNPTFLTQMLAPGLDP